MPDSSDILETALSLAIPRSGRQASDLVLVVDRELTPADITSLATAPKIGGQSIIARLKHSHHLLAQLLAEGRTAVEASYVTGYCESRISILQSDPAFQELIAYYAEQKNAVYLDVHQRLADLGINAMEVLQDRLEDQPKEFSNKALMDLIELTMDRSVAPSKGAPKGSGGGGSANGLNLTVSFVSAPPDGLVIEHENAA
jgi:hypothetical protein